MNHKYNIFKIEKSQENELIKKLESVSLVKQKTINKNNFDLTFYFSSKPETAPVWWYSLYKEFLNVDTEPENMYYFGVLLVSNDTLCYAISLGKTHFYLQKFLIPDFGISLALKIIEPKSMVLKKSRLFGSNQKQSINSYTKFDVEDFESGESIEYLKIKALDKKKWGESTITFGHSVELHSELTPENLTEVIINIEKELIKKNEVVQLPKMEKVKDDELKQSLDKILTNIIDDDNSNSKIGVEEINHSGVYFLFQYTYNSYDLYLSDSNEENESKYYSVSSDLSIDAIKKYLQAQKIKLRDCLGKLRIRVTNEHNRRPYSKSIKEALDLTIDYNGLSYCLRDGDWYCFNGKFLDTLKQSLDKIEINHSFNLNEKDYLSWKTTTKITPNYREYYFNIKMRDENSFNLFDREIYTIQNPDGKDFKIELCDLLKDNTLYFVKIGEPNKLTYNILQSITTIKAYINNMIKVDDIKSLKNICLWFVLEKDIKKITEINSIIFLLVLEEWKKLCKKHDLNPIIWISKHIK